MSKIELPASFMLFFILPRKLQIFCNVFSFILYTADLSTGLSEIANPSRSVSPAPSVSSKKHVRVVEIGESIDSKIRRLISIDIGN